MAQRCEHEEEDAEEESWWSKAGKECYESCGCIGWAIASAAVIGWIYCNCWLSGLITESLQELGVRNDIAFLISIVICFLNYVFTPVFVLSILNLPCVLYFRNYPTTNPCIIYWCKMGLVPDSCVPDPSISSSEEARVSQGSHQWSNSTTTLMLPTSRASVSSRATGTPRNCSASKETKVIGPPSYAECTLAEEEDPPDYATALGRIV